MSTLRPMRSIPAACSAVISPNEKEEDLGPSSDWFLQLELGVLDLEADVIDALEMTEKRFESSRSYRTFCRLGMLKSSEAGIVIGSVSRFHSWRSIHFTTRAWSGLIRKRSCFNGSVAGKLHAPRSDLGGAPRRPTSLTVDSQAIRKGPRSARAGRDRAPESATRESSVRPRAVEPLSEWISSSYVN